MKSTFEVAGPRTVPPVDESLRIGATRASSELVRLLVRTTRLDDRTLAFGDSLGRASGCPVSFVVDERHGPSAAADMSIVGVSDHACRALGLHCPTGYPWQCGDYAYYLARRRFPKAEFFWMIEYDVRFTGASLSSFFTFFAAHDTVDFLAADVRPAELTWHWTASCLAKNARPYRCLFPVTRLSARAIDALLQKRLAHSRSGSRRVLWPNDEGMVATTLKNGPFECRDLNDFGAVFYDSDSFTFDGATNGECLRSTTREIRIHHPVLFGQQYEDKLNRLLRPVVRPSGIDAIVRRVSQNINRRSRW